MVQKIIQALKKNNIIINCEREIPYGTEIRLHNGAIILVYPHKSKYCFQGKIEAVKQVSELLRKELKGGEDE